MRLYFVMAFRDGTVIITSVGLDRVRTLQLGFISFLRFYFECDRVIWWLLGVFRFWIYLGYEVCLLDFVGFLWLFGL